MSNKSNTKKKKQEKSNNEFIKDVANLQKTINKKDLESFAKIDYPIFCFKYLQMKSIQDCSDPKYFFDYLSRLKKLSELGWEEIRKADRHSFGMEKISKESIKPDIPNFVTPEAILLAFRANGNNLPFVGVQCGKIFHVIFMESKFGDIYDHD